MIRLENVSKIFGTGVAGLSEITLFVDKGEFVFLVGQTGSGKTTLLRLLVRDVLPTSGTVIVSDLDLVNLPASKVPHLRKKVGVIFQDLKLLADRTIVENIILPMQVAGTAIEEAVKRAEELLTMVGLSEHRDKFPVQLSGGELQRVAIARALALSPEILLADEPTGNLDPKTAFEIVDLLEKINALGTTIVMATHNIEIVTKLKKRVVGLEKGKLVRDEKHGAKSKTEDVKEKEEESKGSKEDKKEEESATSQAPRNDNDETQDANDEAQKEEKVEEHKKETRKLSDLLARARTTLKKKEEKKPSEEVQQAHGEKAEAEEMPFGFAKEGDVKETNSEENV